MGTAWSSGSGSTARAWRVKEDGLATFARVRSLPNATVLRAPSGGTRPQQGLARKRGSADALGAWIVQADDVLTRAEAQTIISWAESAGMKLGSTLAGGVQRDVARRNSSVAWCSALGECGRRTMVPRLLERIEGATGIGREHYEKLQVVRYRAGEFYGEHLDVALPGGVTLPSMPRATTNPDPRILTAFVYLSDLPPDGGGETAFTKLGRVVQPRLGRLIVWPNVWLRHPTTVDQRMYHEARAVRRGVKYGCNVWVRLKSRVGDERRGRGSG